MYRKISRRTWISGRQTERPLSCATVDKTFFSFFIFQEVLETAIDYRFDEGENPRELEKQQILQLMNLIAEEIYINRFNSKIGSTRIESCVQKGEDLPLEHVRAFRLSKEEVIYNWLRYIDQIIKNYFIMHREKLFFVLQKEVPLCKVLYL
jgi:hypothetical protein